MILQNSVLLCARSEPLFHDVDDNHMRCQYLTKHLDDARNKKQKYESFKKSPMYLVMTLLTFNFNLPGFMKNLGLS